jgi:hypothetical protein
MSYPPDKVDKPFAEADVLELGLYPHVPRVEVQDPLRTFREASGLVI